MKPQGLRFGAGGAQRGAASLIVVMVLFFIVSLMAAYTSRNLIFEQKTSANQYRSTLASEAAEAGLEWAVTMLNGSKVDNDCAADPAAARSFQERYLSVDPATGFIKNADTAFATVPPPPLTPWVSAANAAPTATQAVCVFNGTRWKCKCPYAAALTDPDATPEALGYQGQFPAFRVRMLADVSISPAPGVMRLESVGCTRLDTSVGGCLDLNSPRGITGDGLAIASVSVVLRTGVSSLPAAPLTARGTVTVASPGPRLIAINADLGTGFTVQSGGAVIDKTQIDATSVPGTPSSFSIIDNDRTIGTELAVVDPAPGSLNASERMFAAVFGMRRQTYRDQPGLVTCTASCTASTINTLLASNPNRPIWVTGGLTLDGNIGTTAAPALLIVDGNVAASGGAVTGIVYLWSSASPLPSSFFNMTANSSVRGALVAENNFETSAGGTLTLTYDAAVVAAIRNRMGSYVRLPGSWKDFR